MAHPLHDPLHSGLGADAGDLGSGVSGAVGVAAGALDAHGETGLPSQVELLVELLEADPAELTSGERVDSVQALAALSGQVEAALCRHVASFDTNLDHVNDGARSASAWMGARTEIPASAARAKVLRGRTLRACPVLEDAYRCGVIGTAKVELAFAARVGVEGFFADQERTVVSIIAGLTVVQAKRYLVRWREVALASMGEDDDKAPAEVAENSLHVSSISGGRRAINGDLDPIDGAKFQDLLEAEVTARFASGEFRADDGLLASQRNAQALLALCQRGAKASTVAGEARPSVAIFIDLATMLGLPVHDPTELLNRRCELADGTVVSLARVLELSADATLNAVLGVFGIEGKFHPVGEIRDTRTANARQRRALAVRDQGCIFTGCDRRASWSQAHHVDTWHATHQTTVPRLALLCSFHHHQVHDHGYTLQTDLDGTPTIHRPDGTVLPTPPPGHKIPPDPDPDADLDLDLDLDPDLDPEPEPDPPPGSGPTGSADGTEPRPGARGSGTVPPSSIVRRRPSRFRPLVRKRSRTQLHADLLFRQAGETIALVLARPKR